MLSKIFVFLKNNTTQNNIIIYCKTRKRFVVRLVVKTKMPSNHASVSLQFLLLITHAQLHATTDPSLLHFPFGLRQELRLWANSSAAVF
jgi:hypothetical protein